MNIIYFVIFLVAKKLSMNKCSFILLYHNILSFVVKLPVKLLSGFVVLCCEMASRVILEVSRLIRHILLRCSAVMLRLGRACAADINASSKPTSSERPFYFIICLAI